MNTIRRSRANGSTYRGAAAHVWIFHLCSVAMASAFVPMTTTTTTLQQQCQRPSCFSNPQQYGLLPTVPATSRRILNPNSNTAIKSSLYNNDNNNERSSAGVDADSTKNAAFDDLLEESSDFDKAIRFFRSNSEDIELTRDRFGKIFDAIEERTSDAEVNGSNSDEQKQQLEQQQQQPMLSQSRKEMTEMYSLLKHQGHLRLFGAITRENMPASGSHTVRPALLEAITSLSMNSLTPQPSNTLLYAGIGVALLESIASEFLGLDLNIIFFATFGAALYDQIFMNGALSETCVKILSPETQAKITRHEAGHFLCSYILGCPVEGYVLSAWGALEDPRFRGRGVSAGTSVSGTSE